MTKEIVRLKRLKELETVIEQNLLAFVRVGNALMEISAKRLYEETGQNDFDEYLAERWNWDRSHAFRQMNAAYIHGYLEKSPIGDSLPTNEGVIRPLSKLATFKSAETGRKDPGLWVKAWKRAMGLAKKAKKPITDKFVEAAVNEIIKHDKSAGLPDAPAWNGEWQLDSIYVADATSAEWLASIPEGRADFIVSDPPWRPDAEDGAYSLYEALGKTALKTLKPGGYCAAYLGKLDLPLLIQIMMSYLDYEWTFAVYQPDNSHDFRKTQFKEAWRPIGIFRKPGPRGETIYTPDAMTCTRDKRFHEWQQGIEPARTLIEKYSAKGHLILDPFVGSGTSLLAANRAGRSWIGFEIDEDTARLANRRISDG